MSGECGSKEKRNQLTHLNQSLCAPHSAPEHCQPQSWEAVCSSGFHNCLTFPLSILAYSRSSLGSPLGPWTLLSFIRQSVFWAPGKSSYHKVITWPFLWLVWIHGLNSVKRLRSQKIKLELLFSQFSRLHTRWSQQLEKSDRQLDWVYQMVNWSLSCLPKCLGIKNRSIFYWH